MQDEAEQARKARLAAAQQRLRDALAGLGKAERQSHGTISGARGAASRKSDADSATPMLSAAAKSVT